MVAEREKGKREREGERERDRERERVLLYMDSAVSPNGFWEYGGHCLGNRSVGPAYVMSQVSEVLMPIYLPSCYYKENKRKGGEANGEKGMEVLCPLSCFLLSRAIINFGV